MARVIDTFLFFQELDLLEIRLAYLNSLVDRFVIIEACQTFTGLPKEFVFERNAARFSSYLPKIEYYKVTDSHDSYASVRHFLANDADPSKRKVLAMLDAHSHYNKSKLNWVLDSYHRECIHIALHQVAEDSDFVFLSDLDEIPSRHIMSRATLDLIATRPRVCRQAEFHYFLNYFKDRQWLGSIGGLHSTMRHHSLNILRIDSKKERRIVHPDPLESGGYHFTSCGSLETITAKINSWSHQEFNTPTVLANLERNILSGQDIFQRASGTSLHKVDVDDPNFFDPGMSGLISRYPHLISYAPIKVIKRSLVRDLWLQIARKARGLLAKLRG